jgi:hypothetical protein
LIMCSDCQFLFHWKWTKRTKIMPVVTYCI